MYPTDDPDQRLEPVIGARGMAAVLSRAEPAPALHYPCINHFRYCLETDDNEVLDDSILQSTETVQKIWKVKS